jgi:hypothetical protein
MTNNESFRDGCFFVDNSKIELITTCPWAAYAAIILRRRPAEESAALRFGGFIHKAVEYRNICIALGKPFVEDEQLKLLSKLFTENPLENEGWRNFDSAVKAIRGYNAFYPPEQEDFKIAKNAKGEPFVEQPFAVDTGETIRGWRIIYTGRIDVKIERADGSTYDWDIKTSSVLGDTTWADWAVSEQFKGYCWADWKCTGQEPTGYYIDAIGARESIANAVFNPVTGEVQPLGKSKAVPLELVRQPFFTKVPEGQLQEWYENMLLQVDVFLYYMESNTFPRHHKHCVGKYGKCQFYNVCSLPEKREEALQGTAFKDNTWSPLYS